MMILRSSAPSPFGRKVKIAASMLGLMDRIEVVNADTTDAAEPLRTQNPLGKIPTLVLENGDSLFDSSVILQYLDALAGGGRILPAGWSRFAALRLEALADGVLDASILQVYEGRFRPQERHEPKWLDHQIGKVDRAMTHLEAEASRPPEAYHVGHIALACALGYLDLRFEGRWRKVHPQLVAWLDDFERRVPAFAETRVTP